VRLMLWRIFLATSCLAVIFGLAASYGTSATAQSGQDLMPEESAAKAKSLMQQAITALGGRAFLNVHDSDCSGRIAQFGHNNELMGFTSFRELWVLPAKNRVEYISKSQNTIAGFLLGADGLSITHGGILITVFDGDQGWMIDKAGVSDQPEDVIKTFTEQVKSGMNNMLRSRMNEDGVVLRYAGTDLLDLKEVEWIEISDKDQRSFRMAIDKARHLPVRWVVSVRNPETRERSETATSYTQFLSIDGVQTPLSVSRAQDGRQVSQVFFTGCKYNSNISPDLFTRGALEQRYSEVAKKGYKDAKDSK
jgi:hypothetical protein